MWVMRPALHVIALLLCTFAAAAGGDVGGDDAYDWEKWRQFRSFRPIERPPVPHVKRRELVANPIDAFILARLEANDMLPLPGADRLTLLRRATFDLWGLPPTPQQIEAFLTDESPDAWAKLIDRLLQSPHYGQRYGRHWLDLVRYEQGRVRLKADPSFRGDVHFRDYIVRALNEDKPYDRFLTEQLAGDLLPVPVAVEADPAARRQYFDQITAPAFLSLGDWFDECTDPNRLHLDIVDEQINAASKVFMALSVDCARCHDHPFDPVPTQDYYALGGVFRSTRIIGEFSEFWRDGRDRLTRPLATPKQVAANEAVRERIAEARQNIDAILRTERQRLTQIWKRDEALYRRVAADLPAPQFTVHEAEDFAGQDNLKVTAAGFGDDENELIETQLPLRQWARYTDFRLPKRGRYRLELYMASTGPTPLIVEAGRNTAKSVLTEPVTGTGALDAAHFTWRDAGEYVMAGGPNALRLTSEGGPFPRLDKFRFVLIEPQRDEQVKAAAAKHGLDARLLDAFTFDADNAWPSVAGIEIWLGGEVTERVAGLRGKIVAMRGEIVEYDRVLAVVDQPRTYNLPVHVRGDVYRPRDKQTPRGALRITNHLLPPPAVPADQSGRLQLARWLTDPRHPLTARVMVNRIWQWHFGRGLVDTPNDFGSRGGEPSHPELLDWLAAEFIESGWSIKHVHRLIMTSNAYRMRSHPNPKSDGRDSGEAAPIRNPKSTDPENKLLWRFNRRRLEVEAIYDAMLSTIGKVPRQESGPLDFGKSADRMMYVLTSNRSPLGLGEEIRRMFAVFDYQPDGRPLPQRDESITSAQALWWLNNPLPKYFAGEFVKRLLDLKDATDHDRLDAAWLIALGRKPTDEERQVMLAYLQRSVLHEGVGREEAWKRVCLAIYSSNEFRYVE